MKPHHALTYVKMIMGGIFIKIDGNKPVKCMKGRHLVMLCDTVVVI